MCDIPISDLIILSSPGADKWLARVGIGGWFENVGPMIRIHFAAQFFRPGFSVPTELFHIVVELQAMAVGVESVGGVIDTRVKLRGHEVSFDAYAMIAEKLHRRFELLIICELQTERHVRCCLTQS